MALIYDNYLYIKISVIYYRLSRDITRFILTSCCLGVSLFASEVIAQNISRGFIAEIRLGTNFSQLDGDGLSGFNRIGLLAGFDIIYPTSVNNSLSLGMSYDQRGSSTGIFSPNSISQRIHLTYVSLPIAYSFHQWWYEEYDRYKIRVKGIITPSRLLSTNSSHAMFDNATDSFKRWDISLGVAASYAIGPRASIQLSLERSLLKIYRIPSSQEAALQSYWISIGYLYQLNQSL